MACADRVPVVSFTPECTLLKVRVFSFGYRWHTDPADLAESGHCEITVDLRVLLRNPIHDPALRQQTGLEPVVRDYVLATPGARGILAATAVLTRAALGPVDRQGLAVTVAFGCAGGRHRSVVLATALRNLLAADGIGAEVSHHDILREVTGPAGEVGGER
jgi:UPF0042 nucleotide-binding protein